MRLGHYFKIGTFLKKISKIGQNDANPASFWFTLYIYTHILLGFIRRFFFIKAKKLFCTGCPKSDVWGGKTIFFLSFFIGASAKKYWVRSQIFRNRLPEDLDMLLILKDIFKNVNKDTNLKTGITSSSDLEQND